MPSTGTQACPLRAETYPTFPHQRTGHETKTLKTKYCFIGERQAESDSSVALQAIARRRCAASDCCVALLQSDTAAYGFTQRRV